MNVDRARFSNNTLNIGLVLIPPDGWVMTGGLRHSWEHDADFRRQRGSSRATNRSIQTGLYDTNKYASLIEMDLFAYREYIV